MDAPTPAAPDDGSDPPAPRAGALIDRAIATAQRQHFLVFTLTVLIAAGGLVGLNHLHVDAFPDVTTVQVDVGTEAPGLAPEEVEKLITFPIETAMNGLPDVDVVRSISSSALGRDGRLQGRHGHLLRAAAGLRAPGRRAPDPGRLRARDGADHHRRRQIFMYQ